jgi:hypothetical protein
MAMLWGLAGVNVGWPVGGDKGRLIALGLLLLAFAVTLLIAWAFRRR